MASLLKKDTNFLHIQFEHSSEVYRIPFFTYLSLESHFVFSSYLNKSFRSFMVKCLSTFSCSSTTQLLRAFLWACLWKIFSSMVPVYDYKRDTNQVNTYLLKSTVKRCEMCAKFTKRISRSYQKTLLLRTSLYNSFCSDQEPICGYHLQNNSLFVKNKDLGITYANTFPFFIINFIMYLRDNGKNINPFRANPTKWSNTVKQFVANLPNCLSVFDHFVILALKGLISF